MLMEKTISVTTLRPIFTDSCPSNKYPTITGYFQSCSKQVQIFTNVIYGIKISYDKMGMIVNWNMNSIINVTV